jgi:cyclase
MKPRVIRDKTLSKLALMICSLLIIQALASGQSVNTPEQTKRTDGTIEGVEKVVIANGIYQFKASYDGYVSNCNSTVIVNKDDVLVFDTNTRPSTARAILAEIRKITRKPVRYVVNSHWHPDHWSGNEVYAGEFTGLEIIATEETLRYMKNVSPAFPALFSAALKRQQAAFDKEMSSGMQSDGTPLTDEARRTKENRFRVYQEFVAESQKVRRVLPTRTYRENLTLKQGAREFRFMSLVGDASDSTVLYLPKEKILITGDLLVHPVTWTTQSYRITPWMNSLKMLSRLEVNVIIPGHGPALHDKNYLNLVAELFESVITQVQAALRQGMVTVEEVQQAVKLDAIRLKFTKDDKALNASFEATAANLIKKVYLEARDGMESRR